MASIHKDIPIDARPDDVWDAVRDFGALHTRLVPGFVTDTKLDGDARIVTFANGTVARELLVDCDDARRRLVYAIANERVKHYSASVQVLADGDARSRMIWIVDVLPNEIAPYIAAQMDQGAACGAEQAGAERGIISHGRRYRSATAPAGPPEPDRASVPIASGSRSGTTARRAPPSMPPPARRSFAPSRRASTATSRRWR